MFQLGYEPHNRGESRSTPSCLLQKELDPVEARQYFLKFSVQRDEGSLTKLNEGFGGPGRDRTDDLFHAMEARSQLRHRPTWVRRAIPILSILAELRRRVKLASGGRPQIGY